MIDPRPPVITNPEYSSEYYIFVPYRATLYGRDRGPYHFLRVVDDCDQDSTVYVIRQWDDPSDPDSLYLIESVQLTTFIQFISYGYTPYIECLFTALPGQNAFDEWKGYVLTESIIRDYDARVRALIDICEKKRYSIAGRSTSSNETSELVDELSGVLHLWEIYMNQKRIISFDCLSHIQGNRNFRSIPIKKFKEQSAILCQRVVDGNHAYMPFKVSDEILQEMNELARIQREKS